MNSSVYLSTVIYYPPNLSKEQISRICGELLSKNYAEVIPTKDIKLNEIPNSKLIKMTKEKYVDAFFEDGSLQLGSFSYYNQFDHEEIGDMSEGSFILVGRSSSGTVIAEAGSGYNNYIFCCYSGEPDPECLKRFGYDSGIIIHDVQGFSSAISKTLGAQKSCFAKCIYSRDKVIVGENQGLPNAISARLKNITNDGKYFIKPDKYSNQSEFRFTWEVEYDLETSTIIKCPEARQFCEKLS